MNSTVSTSLNSDVTKAFVFGPRETPRPYYTPEFLTALLELCHRGKRKAIEEDNQIWSERARDEYDTPEFRELLLAHFREAVRLAQTDHLDEIDPFTPTVILAR